MIHNREFERAAQRDSQAATAHDHVELTEDKLVDQLPW